MLPEELRSEMLAMWDAVLAGGFGVDKAADLSDDQVKKAISLWRDEMAEHPQGEEMDELMERVVEAWPE